MTLQELLNVVKEPTLVNLICGDEDVLTYRSRILQDKQFLDHQVISVTATLDGNPGESEEYPFLEIKVEE